MVFNRSQPLAKLSIGSLGTNGFNGWKVTDGAIRFEWQWILERLNVNGNDLLPVAKPSFCEIVKVYPSLLLSLSLSSSLYLSSCMICQSLSLVFVFVFVFAFPYFCLFQIVTERISRCLLQRGRIDRLIAQFPHSGKTARIMSSICSTCKVVWSERKFKILFSSLFNKFPLLRNWSWVRTTVCKYALSGLKQSMEIGQ